MSPLYSIGIRNVTLHWRHSLAALLSIAASFFSINVFQGYIKDLGQLYYISFRHRSMYGDLLVTNEKSESPEARGEPSKYDLGPDIQAAIAEFAHRHSDQIQIINRFLVVQGTVSNGKTSTIFIAQGTDIKEGAEMRGPIWHWNTLYGEPLDHFPEGGRILLGQLLGRTMDCWPDPVVIASTSTGGYKPENRKFKCSTSSLQLSVMTENGQLNALDLEVAGLADGGYLDVDRKYIWMGLPDAQRLANTDHVTLESMLLKDPTQAPEVRQEFHDEVEPRFPQAVMMRWQDHPRIGDLYNHTMELLGIFRNFVVTVIISISALSILNTMTKSLSERTREIGTLLSIGYRPRHIRLTFITESVFLCFLGVVAGAVGSVICAGLVNGIGIFYKAGILSAPVPFRIMLDPGLELASGLGLILLGSAATLFACTRVLRKEVIECLQHV